MTHLAVDHHSSHKDLAAPSCGQFGDQDMIDFNDSLVFEKFMLIFRHFKKPRRDSNLESCD